MVELGVLMVTRGVINAVQIPVDELGQLASANTPGQTVAEEYQQKEVRGQYSEDDHERARGLGFADARAYQDYTNQHVAVNGVLNPVRIEAGSDWGEDRDVLSNGYHRWAAAKTAGISHLPAFRTQGIDPARDAAIGQSMRQPANWKGDD